MLTHWEQIGEFEVTEQRLADQTKQTYQWLAIRPGIGRNQEEDRGSK